MSSADRAAELRAQADALDDLARMETDLLAAKESGDPAATQEAAEALRAARAQTRDEGFGVGGDAYISTNSDEEV